MAKPVLPQRKVSSIPVGGERAERALVVREEIVPGQRLPLLVRARADGVNLLEWGAEQRETVRRLLAEHGGLLFRGFGVREPETLASVVTAIAAEPIHYMERSSPRTHLAHRVYTSTEHPADQQIFLHNEQSYSLTFPLLIAFACAVPAIEGGSTPIADVRLVLARIASSIRDRFEAGYLLVRNYGSGLGLRWQDVFQTEERSEVEAYCARHRIEWEWKGGDGLRTRQVRRAFGRHPRTGEEVWFNHATFFHPSTLDPALASALTAAVGRVEDLPNATFYADGQPIESDVMEQLRAAYHSATARFTWRAGDLLLLDNMLVAHGRDAYTGPRRILTAMADTVSWDDVT